MAAASLEKSVRDPFDVLILAMPLLLMLMLGVV